MTENNADKIVLGVALYASPLPEHYVIIVLLAMLGGLVRVSRTKEFKEGQKSDAWWMLFRSVSFAFAMSWIVSNYISERYGFVLRDTIWAAAFIIAFVGDDWFKIHRVVISMTTDFLRNFNKGDK